jgi:predicted nucleic-acid-binding protein
MPVFQFEKPDVIQGSIASARQTSLGLAELLIAHSAMNAGCKSVLTFDKKAAKLALFELLKG